jgi:glyoxylase-like metal-dependent hydrolase (beta-lactamase superfamily II)
MQEISEHVYIERAYPGVTLGAINWPHGLILIDSPFRPEDVRAWRASLLNLGGGVERLLVNLDVHADRTLGARAMECTVVGHEKMAQVFRNRPVTFKAQGNETGAEWEQYNGLGSIRWAPPEITFTDKIRIYWSEPPLELEYRPGPAAGAIWAVVPSQQVVFIGDAVLCDQPPFLAGADLSAWLKTLETLNSPEYANFTVVNGRNGLIAHKHIQNQIDLLRELHARLNALAEAHAAVEDTESLIPEILKKYAPPAYLAEQYTHRLKWGLSQYFTRHYQSNGAAVEEE